MLTALRHLSGRILNLARLAAVSSFALFSIDAAAANPAGEIDRDDPNFVTASFLVIGPGDELFSCVGHAAIRLECPVHKLDYVFSCESENVSSRLASFFAGRLKMGVFAVPTSEFLDSYREEGREVRQYRLNLPPQAECRLWKILDERVAEGADMPYDYIRRGCASSMLASILDSIAPLAVEEAPWPAKFAERDRAIIAAQLEDCPWTRLALHAIIGSDLDRDIANVQKLKVPGDCLWYLKGAKIAGVPLVGDGDGELLVAATSQRRAPIVTPFAAAWLALALVALALWRRWRWLGAALFAAQFAAGCAFGYLIFFSSLPATSWNWLFVVFNPLMPTLAFAAVRSRSRALATAMFACALLLAVWMALMVTSTNQLTDPAYVVIACAYAQAYALFFRFRKVGNLK